MKVHAMEEVQIKWKSIIKPVGETWRGTIALTEWDMIVGRGYVPCVYWYGGGGRGDQDRATLVHTLKQSLGTALAHFYPLAGRLHLTQGGRMELRCHESTWGAELAEAETPFEMAHFNFPDATTPRSGQFGGHHLMPQVDYRKPPHEQPLLLVQVTFFRCGGVSIGITVSRAVADGLGSLHFIREWARIARGEAMEVAPVHDRGLLGAGEPPKSPESPNREYGTPPPPPPLVMVPPLLPCPGEQSPHPIMTNLVETTMVMLPLTKTQLDRLKHTANFQANHTTQINPSRRSYSRIEALTAHIWRCSSKARGHCRGNKLNSIGVAIDVRGRVTPPLPPNYFGNAVTMMTATSSSEELDTNGLGYACARIRLAIDRVTEEYVWRDLDYWKRQHDIRVWRGLRTTEGIYVNPDVMVTSWFTLPLFGLDFGWGKETHMAPGDQTMEGISMILPGTQHGSALVAMCLQPLHVHTFKAYFYDQLC